MFAEQKGLLLCRVLQARPTSAGQSETSLRKTILNGSVAGSSSSNRQVFSHFFGESLSSFPTFFSKTLSACLQKDIGEISVSFGLLK